MGFGLAILAACAPKVEVTALPSPVEQPEQDFVAALLAMDLRDPNSAEYRGWQGFDLSNGGRIVCGQINATNGFGGYVGYSPFYIIVDKKGREMTMLGSDDMNLIGIRISCSMAGL